MRESFSINRQCMLWDHAMKFAQQVAAPCNAAWDEVRCALVTEVSEMSVEESDCAVHV